MADFEQSTESAGRKIAGAVAAIMAEDDELKTMMRDLLKDAIVDMQRTIRHGGPTEKAAIQRLLLPHLAASATASAGQSDIRDTVDSIHAETLAAMMEPDDVPASRRLAAPTLEADA